jgi:tetratricopeptide (TPR) repeat protein
MQALHDAEHAIKLEPQWAKPRSRKALAHLHLHQYEQAIQAYKMCIKLEPTNEDYKVALKEAQHRLARQKDPKASSILPSIASSGSLLPSRRLSWCHYLNVHTTGRATRGGEFDRGVLCGGAAAARGPSIPAARLPRRGPALQ